MAEADLSDDALAEYAERVEKTHDATPELDRANTRRRLVDPLLEMLGWPVTMPEGDVYVDVEYEITDNEYVDYALVEGDRAHAFVVAVPFGKEIEDGDRDRAVTLLNAEDVDWAILTNGHEVELHYRNDSEGVLFYRADADDLGANRARLGVVTYDGFTSGRAAEVAAEHAALGDALETLADSREALVEDVVGLARDELDLSQLDVEDLAREYVDGVEDYLEHQRDALLTDGEGSEEHEEDDNDDDEGNQNSGGDESEAAATEDGEAEDGEAGESDDTVTQQTDGDDDEEGVERNDADTAEARMLRQYLSTVVQRDAGVVIEDGEFRSATDKTMLEATQDAVASLIRRRYLRQGALPTAAEGDEDTVLNSEPEMPDGNEMENEIDLGGGLYLNADEDADFSALLRSVIDSSVENERRRSQLEWISRTELDGDVDETVAVFPADPDVADGLDDGFGAWGGVVIDREPDWFALYVREPVGEVRYIGRVQDVVPVEEFGFENLEEYDWYDPDGPQKYMIRFTDTYRLCTPLSLDENESGWAEGANYTTLQDFKSSDYIESLNA